MYNYFNMQEEFFERSFLFPDYEVSNFGNIKNKRGKILKQHLNREGYCVIGLRKWKRSHQVRVHRLVAFQFLPNPLDKPDIHHKDHDKTNNRVDNLMWVTPQENNAFNFDNPNCQVKRGFKGTRTNRFTGYYNVNGQLFESTRQAEETLGISRQTVYNWCKKGTNPNCSFIPAIS